MHDELPSKIALRLCPKVTAEVVRAMEAAGISPSDFFELPTTKLASLLETDERSLPGGFERDNAMELAYKELKFVQRHRIRPLFLLDDDYPYRLAQCADAPVMIFVLGNASLDMTHMVAVVGTRRPTPQGAAWCDTYVADMASMFSDLGVVSGLAYGVDSIAHKASLKHQVPTIAVVAHGLNMVYPAQHRGLAHSIIEAGGAIVSEYPSGVKPYRQHFLERNRVIAGLSDATVIVESGIQGGGMSTINCAVSYGRDTFAVPGRPGDEMSAGCNHLIHKMKAQLINSSAEMVTAMEWKPFGMKAVLKEPVLFPEVEEEMQPIFNLLKEEDRELTVDEICNRLGLKASEAMSRLMEMEMDGLVVKCPGARFALIR